MIEDILRRKLPFGAALLARLGLRGAKPAPVAPRTTPPPKPGPDFDRWADDQW
jgi:hypothetical protein